MSKKDHPSGSRRQQDKISDADRVYWHFVVIEPRHDLTLKGRALRSWRAKFKDKCLRSYNSFDSSGTSQGAITYCRRKVERRIRKRIFLSLVRVKTICKVIIFFNCFSLPLCTLPFGFEIG
ncbi:hypothetical protein ElyMa_004076400 [Elysia marginata]|uniref:Uncharacterized protein n=1 Tax=Elysia marginata TaxID=1093978 RepID=A0AAV4G862_9GAST|nr:hypothetical protein ElyMa_004076400 [Elysia marginata]